MAKATLPERNDPEAAIVWLDKERRCRRCQRPLSSPGLVGRLQETYLCWECLMDDAPSLGWLLWLAQVLRLGYGTWPGTWKR